MDSAVVPRYSVVAAVYNEADNVAVLCDRLYPVLTSLAADSWEIVLVDDGSTDRSWPEIEALHRRQPRIHGLKFSRNFGHHVALTAGIEAARGDRVVTMDSDLQDRPEEIPVLASRMDEGYDVVFAVRGERQHTAAKRATSQLFFWLLNRLSDVPYPITGSVFRLMSRRFVDELVRLREHHRFYTGLTAWLGFAQTSVPVTHGRRHAGETKYTVRKMLRLALDSITSFSAKPLFYVLYLGGAISLAALVFAAYTVVRYFITGYSTQGWASLMTAITFLNGLMLMVLGIMGQYVGRVFEEVKSRPLYIVESTTAGYEGTHERVPTGEVRFGDLRV